IKHLKTSMQRIFHIKNFKKVISLGIFVKDKLVGYNINEVVNNGYVVGHFQQANLKYSTAIYSYLMQETAIYLDKLNCRYINLEQDLGIHGLRKWKLSYSNETFFKKYIIYNK